MINFAYFKDDTLFFVFNHPAGKQEFDNNIQHIKNALNFAPPNECKDINIQDIRAFVTHSPKKKNQEILKPQQQNYKERSKGVFSINIKDERLNNLVKSIRDIIKEKNTSK